jgi:hypothetical protein
MGTQYPLAKPTPDELPYATAIMPTNQNMNISTQAYPRASAVGLIASAPRSTNHDTVHQTANTVAHTESEDEYTIIGLTLWINKAEIMERPLASTRATGNRETPRIVGSLSRFI